METQDNINTGFSQITQTTPQSFHVNNMEISKAQYIKFLTITKGLANKSIKTYLTRYRFFKEWLEKNNLQINKNTIEDFLFEKKESGSKNSTINTYIQAINHIVDCHKFNNIKINVENKINGLPKNRPTIIPLSKEEVNKLLKTHLIYKNRNGVDCSMLDFQYLTFTEFLAFTGCRYDEAASLKVKNLDIDNKRALLVDTKNNENRFVFINGPLVDNLKIMIRNKQPDDLVLTNSMNKKMHSSDYGNDLKKRAAIAGISKHVNPHLLRHTFATIYYNYTHDIAIVATLLGHKDIKTTYETYVHLDTEGIQQAANRHPLISQYIPVNEALINIKNMIDKLKIDDDKRLEYKAEIINNKLEIYINIKEA